MNRLLAAHSSRLASRLLWKQARAAQRRYCYNRLACSSHTLAPAISIPPRSGRWFCSLTIMAHRKVDVDSFNVDEDDFEDTSAPASAAAVNPAEAAAAAQACASEVAGLVNKGNISGALSRALDLTNAPYGGDEMNPAKDTSLKAVMDVLSAAKSADIPGLIASLGPLQQDLLLKYIYRGMSIPQTFPCNVLLAWHEKVLEVAGVGSIIRVMSDRRRL